MSLVVLCLDLLFDRLIALKRRYGIIPFFRLLFLRFFNFDGGRLRLWELLDLVANPLDPFRKVIFLRGQRLSPDDATHHARAMEIDEQVMADDAASCAWHGGY